MAADEPTIDEQLEADLAGPPLPRDPRRGQVPLTPPPADDRD